MTNKKSIRPVLAVATFVTLYSFTRQSFIVLFPGIKLAGFTGSSFFGGANIAHIFALIYAVLQIPYGAMIDSFGIKKSVSILSLLMGVGFTISTFSRCIIGFGIGRLITALGCAGAFICAVKIAEIEYGNNKIAKIVGILVGFSLLFTVVFIKFGAPAVNSGLFNWRYLYGIKAIATWGVFAYFKFFLKEKKTEEIITHKEEQISFTQFFKIISKSYVAIFLMLFALVFFMVFYGINETTYIGNILEKLNISTTNTYAILLGGFFLGFVTMPFVAKILGELFTCILMCGGLIGLCGLMYVYPQKILAYTLCFLIGYSNGLQMVIVEMAAKILPPSVIGRLSGLFNVLFVGGVVIAQEVLKFLVPRFSLKVIYLFAIGCASIALVIIFIVSYLIKRSKRTIQ